MVIPSRQTEVGTTYGQGPGDRRRQEEPILLDASGGKPSLPVWRTAQAAAQDWLGVGEAQVRPSQLLFVFFLLGSFPKQTNQGGKMKGTRRRGKCRARWLDPEKPRAPLERAPAGAPVAAADPLWA